MLSGNPPGKPLKWIGLGLLTVLTTAYATTWLLVANYSWSRHGSVDLNFGSIAVPAERTRDWANHSDLINDILSKRARENGDFLAQLGSRQNIGRANRVLQATKPWGRVGTHGDYDFFLTELVLALYAFADRPDILYPDTVRHIVDVLLTEKGGDSDHWTPGIGGLPLPETENHILMTEGSRYLTNQWIAKEGNADPEFDNLKNGLEHYLLGFLEGMERAGVWEYNSIPYAGYTIRALLNLESFASTPVRASARRVLDRMNWDYALGSLAFRRYAPFRRAPGRARETQLDADYHTSVMKAWMSLGGVQGLQVRHAGQHAMWAGFTSYRLPDAVADWVLSKPAEYFVQIGHGRGGSPEIYSGGPGFLITAGGSSWEFPDFSVTRPTTLMLDDDAMDVKDLLHFAGPGEKHTGWNNTGVHKRFAVAAGPVRIPEGWVPTSRDGLWSVYERRGQHIGVYSSEKLGIFCLLMPKAGNSAQELAAANPDEKLLQTRFQWPDGSAIDYDVWAAQSQWVIKAVNGKPVDRLHEAWPLMQGELPGHEKKSRRE